MAQIFQTLTKRPVNVLGVLIGLAVVSSILLHSGCGMTSSPNIRTNPTPTPIPTPTPDTTPPTVTSFAPTAGATNVRIDANVTVTFSEAMDPATVNGSTVELRGPSNAGTPATVSYDAGSFTATLDPTTSLSAGVTYTARVKGGSADPRVKDAAGNALAADVTWTFTTTAPLQVLSATPTDGAVDVPTGVAPRVKFSKPIDFRTAIESKTILLQDAAGNPVPISVGFTSKALTAFAILPQGLLQPLQTYTVTLKGGPNEPHITDTMGTPLDSDYIWSFTTAAYPQITTSSIFAPTVTPANPISNDSQAVELGMKFRSDSDGIITGVRFYKGGSANGGEHVGRLWNSTGTMLGSVTFTNETSSGWQQALFPTPIQITSNTTYVVSYFAPQGRYAADLGYFASTGVDSPPLHALQDGVDGGNGVFLRSPTGGFPTNTFMSANYYVDVFGDPMLAPPQVLSTYPAPGQFVFLPMPGVQFNVSVTFTEPIDPTSVNSSTVLLTDGENNPVPFAISFGAGNITVTLNPSVGIGGVFTVTLKGGVNTPHITDATGTPLATDYTWTFGVGFGII
jgi:Domain of unknown function (DUF4082)/Bacterial Ig-like domain